MLQELLTFMPRETGPATLAFASVGAACGLALWVSGARFSRYIVTLAAVAIGTCVGIGLPRWFGWGIDGMGPAVGGAIVLGASGYVLHRMWVAAWAGLVLSGWAALGTWMALAHDQPWTWPLWSGTTVPLYLKQIWEGVPPDVAHALPVVCGAAFLIASIPTAIWPRAGMVMLYSAAGATLAALTGLVLVNLEQPQWLAKVPPKVAFQIGAMLLVVAIGAALQWQLYFRKPKDVRDPMGLS